MASRATREAAGGRESGAGSRTRSGRFGAEPAQAEPVPEDRDGAMRLLAQREAVEVLTEQLEVERRERRRLTLGDFLVTAAMLGATFGAGYAGTRYAQRRRRMRRGRR